MVSAISSFSSSLVPFLTRDAVSGISPVARKNTQTLEINPDNISSLAFSPASSGVSSSSSSNSIVQRMIDTALVTPDSLFATQQMAGMSVLGVDSSSTDYEDFVSDTSFSAMDNYQEIIDENTGEVSLIEEYANRVIERNRERRSSSRDEILQQQNRQSSYKGNDNNNVDDIALQDTSSYDDQYTISNVESDTEFAQQQYNQDTQQYQTQVQFNNYDMSSTMSATNTDFSSFISSAINTYSKISSVASPTSNVTFYSPEKSFDFAV